MYNYFRYIDNEDGSLAERTINIPIDSNITTTMHKVKSKGFLLNWFDSLPRFCIIQTPLLYYIANTAITLSIIVISVKNTTILVSFHPDNSK